MLHMKTTGLEAASLTTYVYSLNIPSPPKPLPVFYPSKKPKKQSLTLKPQWPAPSYQESTLQNYFETTPPPYGSTVYGTPYYNASGRGYPDVSAVGQNILLYAYGEPQFVGGTSASAPIFASIITLINEERIAAGKGPVGFLNPTLYANPGAFTDVSFFFGFWR